MRHRRQIELKLFRHHVPRANACSHLAATQRRSNVRAKRCRRPSASPTAILDRIHGKPLLVFPAAALVTTATGFEMSETTHFILCYAPVFSIACLNIAPLKTIWEIVKSKTVGDLPALPFFMYIGNGTVWTTYGVLHYIAGLEWKSLVFAHSIYIVVGGFSACVYVRYGRSSIGMRDLVIPGTLVSLALGMALTLPTATAIHAIGFLGAFEWMCFLTSPLVAMSTVIKKKDSSSIPVWTSLAMFMDASTWTVYATVIVNDPYIWVPGSFGTLAATSQLALIYKYPPKAKRSLDLKDELL